MATEITNHKCPACTGPLHFVGASGKLECDYCGSSFEVAEIEALYAVKEEKAEEAFVKAEEKRVSGGGDSWDTSGLTDDWGADAAGMRAYSCPSCGAELICDATTAATHCPYCNNPTVVPGQFGGTLKPDLIIPFKLSKEDAKAALKKHYHKKYLLPKAFTKNNHIEEIQGIYVPFWLFDGNVDADCVFEGTREHTRWSGDTEIITTEYYDIGRSGTVKFSKIPVDGSKKMPDDYMDSIEPFHYDDLKPFSTAYLPGYLADRYDVTAEESAERADKRCELTAVSAMRNDVTGFGYVVEKSANLHINRGKVHYALMPVYTLRTKWGGKDYLFMMNGQTGKLVGDLPVSKKKFWGYLFGTMIGTTAILQLLGIGKILVELLGLV